MRKGERGLSSNYQEHGQTAMTSPGGVTSRTGNIVSGGITNSSEHDENVVSEGVTFGSEHAENGVSGGATNSSEHAEKA